MKQLFAVLNLIILSLFMNLSSFFFLFFFFCLYFLIELGLLSFSKWEEFGSLFAELEFEKLICRSQKYCVFVFYLFTGFDISEENILKLNKFILRE